MARCTLETCRRWRPDLVVRFAKTGLRVDGAWFCSNDCVEAAAAQRLRDAQTREVARRPLPQRLGSVLLQQRSVTPGQLNEALAAQRVSGLRLGAQLQSLGYATREHILRALSAQNGVRYLTTIDLAAVRTAPAKLSADEVRALGLVPFRETADAVFVACTAPVPYAALGAMKVLIGRDIEPFLVSDEDFLRLQLTYEAATDASMQTTVCSISDGASRIAAVAAEAGDVTVKEAQLNPYTWVRIAADGRISTLLVPPQVHQTEELDEWLAATTRH